MSKREANTEITHRDTDVDFNVYYDAHDELESITITGVYLTGSQVDLIDVIDDNVLYDLESDICDDVEHYDE